MRTKRFQSTPLMRGETVSVVIQRSAASISIHSPHARGDGTCESKRSDAGAFQSTPLMRGETIHTHGNIGVTSFQSTPLMRGETQRGTIYSSRYIISIHSPHARGDRFADRKQFIQSHFNPLPSCEGRPRLVEAKQIDDNISIHSPHARGDSINL